MQRRWSNKDDPGVVEMEVWVVELEALLLVVAEAVARVLLKLLMPVCRHFVTEYVNSINYDMMIMIYFYLFPLQTWK